MFILSILQPFLLPLRSKIFLWSRMPQLLILSWNNSSNLYQNLLNLQNSHLRSLFLCTTYPWDSYSRISKRIARWWFFWSLYYVLVKPGFRNQRTYKNWDFKFVRYTERFGANSLYQGSLYRSSLLSGFAIS